jgi:hypothetical protein
LRRRDERLGPGRRLDDRIVENDESQGQGTCEDCHCAQRCDPALPAAPAISHGDLILIERVGLARRRSIYKRQKAGFELLRSAGYVCVANSRRRAS